MRFPFPASVASPGVNTRLLLVLPVALAFLPSPACRCGSGSHPPGSSTLQGEGSTAPAPPAADPCKAASVKVDGAIRSLDVDGVTREYVIDVPDAPAGKRLPLVMSFHGIGADPESLREVTGMATMAQTLDFVAVHPRGMTVELGWRVGPGWSVSAGENRDVRLAEELIDRVSASACIDASRVFAVGFSNGAHLAHVLACRLSGRIAGIGAVGGALEEMAKGCGQGLPVRAVILHGDADRIVPVEEGRAAYRFWSSRNGCKREEKLSGPCVEARDCSAGADGGAHGGADVVYCEIPGMGHSWPRYSDGQPIDGTFSILESLLHVTYSISEIRPADAAPPPPVSPPP